MNDNEALAAVRGILEKGWCKGDLHQDAEGREVFWHDPRRTASCMMGAIELVSKNEIQGYRLVGRVHRAIGDLGYFRSSNRSNIAYFNDSIATTLEDVLLVLKHAEELK